MNLSNMSKSSVVQFHFQPKWVQLGFEALQALLWEQMESAALLFHHLGHRLMDDTQNFTRGELSISISVAPPPNVCVMLMLHTRLQIQTGLI